MELKNCPCCGGNAFISQNVTNASISCECGISVTSFKWSSDEKRIENLTNIWNKRVI